MDIDKRLKYIIKQIESLGFLTLIVGGAVRNHLLGLKINDYDIATAASLKDVEQAFLDSKLIYRDQTPWALKVYYQGFKVEVSTFRKEFDYVDRVPQRIEFIDSFNEDVIRRDFTINAIGYSLKDGFVDYTGGIEDIDNKIVKVIGDPEKRFNEDPMRILRGIRLASTLDFTIEKSTLHSIKIMYPLSLESKSDHIANELKKTISGNNFDYVYKEVSQLFNDISNNKFINIKVNDRSLLLQDDLLYIYLRYLIKIDNNNKIFKVLNINKNFIEKIDKLDPLVHKLLKDLDFEEMIFLSIDYNKDNLDYIVNLLNTLEILSEKNTKNYQQVKENGYLSIADLDIENDDIKDDISIERLYEIFRLLQKEVISNKLLNKKDVLIKRFQQLNTY